MKSIRTNVKRLKVDENELELAYYITVDEVKSNNQIEILESYGVCIESSSEKASVSGITHSRKKIEELERILSENFVTPVSLPYVVQDIVGVTFL